MVASIRIRIASASTGSKVSRVHVGERFTKIMFATKGFEFGSQAIDLVAGSRDLGRPGVVLRTAQAATSVTEARENGLHRVVVALQDRIELVIVTAGTADGESQEGLADRADDFVKFILASAAHRRLRRGRSGREDWQDQRRENRAPHLLQRCRPRFVRRRNDRRVCLR